MTTTICIDILQYRNIQEESIVIGDTDEDSMDEVIIMELTMSTDEEDHFDITGDEIDELMNMDFQQYAIDMDEHFDWL